MGLRLLVVAGLVAASVASPLVAVLVTPFIPVVVALRLRREPSTQFLVLATIASLITAAAVSLGRNDGLAVLLAIEVAVVLLVALLGRVQALASLPDPAVPTAPSTAQNVATPEAEAPVPWMEPRIDSGFSLVAASWLVPFLLCIVVLLPVVGEAQLRDLGQRAVDDTYSSYTRECAKGGSFEQFTSLCTSMREQRQTMTRMTRDHAPALFSVLAALVAVAGAVTSHLAMTWRLRASGLPTRPRRPIRELEVHWSVAYLTALGLVLTMSAAGGASAVADWVQAAGLGIAAFGMLLIVGQGAGLAAVTLRNGGMFQRIVAVLLVLFASPFVIGMLCVLGIVDLALHPRRRVSDSLTGRGSGS